MKIEWLKLLWHDHTRLRSFLFIIDFGLIIFWAYSVAYVSHHPPEKGGDGFEFIISVWMTSVLLVFTLPALLFLLFKRTIRLGAYVTLAAIIVNGLLWNEALWNGGLRRGLWWPVW